MRSVTLLALVLVATPVAALQTTPEAGGAEALSFATPTALGRFGGEPSIDVAEDGTVYVVFPDWPGSRLYRRDPGETFFRDLGRPNYRFGGGDEDVAVGPDGTVAIVGMYPDNVPVDDGTLRGWCSSVTISRDRGDTWSAPVPALCVTSKVDRPWIQIDEQGHFWVLQHAVCCTGQHSVHWSMDGITWMPASVATPVGGFPGNMFVDTERGRIYAASACTQKMAVCVTSSSTLAPMPVWEPNGAVRTMSNIRGLGHVSGAVDDAGNLYVTWADITMGSNNIYAARSTNGGITWSPPSLVSGGNAATMPWIVAGADGKAAVVWYEADERRTDPNLVSRTAAWHVYAAARDWNTPDGWQTARVSETPNHYGPICTYGASCGDRGVNRNLLDFFEADIGPEGKLHVTWSDDRRWTVQHAEQASGMRLK